jgi:hypothetical protein
VISENSGKLYRIRPTRQMNVDELDQSGVRIAAWCFGPEGNLPIGDGTQKIALENNEPAALATAATAMKRRQDFDDRRCIP